MNHYVYQFALVPNGSNGYGLIFSEESDSFNSPVFAISNKEDINNSSFIFPGEIDGKYYEFKLNRNHDFEKYESKQNDFILLIKSYKIKSNIYFNYFCFSHQVINLYRRLINAFYRYKYIDSKYYSHQVIKYIGERTDIIKYGEEFLVIMPRDLILLDNLYKEFKLCLVGYTPTFNNDVLK